MQWGCQDSSPETWKVEKQIHILPSLEYSQLYFTISGFLDTKHVFKNIPFEGINLLSTGCDILEH